VSVCVAWENHDASRPRLPLSRLLSRGKKDEGIMIARRPGECGKATRKSAAAKEINTSLHSRKYCTAVRQAACVRAPWACRLRPWREAYSVSHAVHRNCDWARGGLVRLDGGSSKDAFRCCDIVCVGRFVPLNEEDRLQFWIRSIRVS